MRHTLMMAAAAAALLATPALAQEAPTADAMATPPSTDPIGTPPAETVPEAAAEAADDLTATAQPETAIPAETADAGNDIVDVMRADGQFSTLLTALDATGLSGVLESDDSISILAPTDAAFAALPAGELDRLMQPENREELQDLLLYHVLNADVQANQIENRRGPVVTGSGAQILLDGTAGSLRADSATIINAELRGSNGAVLVVDQVLSPDTSLAAQGDEDTEVTTDAVADASVEAERDAAVSADVEAEADVSATTTPEAEATEEPTGAEIPATPPVNEAQPTEPTGEEDPATPQS